MTSTDPWVEFLRGYVGEVEHPDGSNCCRVCDEYGSLGGVTCYAWCCALQDLATRAVFGQRLLQTAAVGQAVAYAKAGVRGLLWVPREEVSSGQTPIRVGDLPCYDYGGRGNWNDMHIEGVVNPSTQVRFQTIGGNRRNRCDYWWNSLNNTVMGFIRLPFEQVGLGAQPTPEEVQLATVAELIQEMHNAIFDEQNGMQKNIADAKQEATTARGEAAAAHQLAVEIQKTVQHIEKMEGSEIDAEKKSGTIKP